MEIESTGTVIVGEENKEDAEERLGFIDIRLLLFFGDYMLTGVRSSINKNNE